MHDVEGPAAEEIDNVAGDDQAMPDAKEIRNAAGEQPRDSCLSTTTPVKARVTETKYQPESFLKDVRGLLSTGLLEGFRVTYKKNEVEMTGRINGQGYSCGCSECGYSNIMNACEFEQHSGESSNNQNDHIFLDSGISLYRVIQALKFTRLYLLGDLIEEQIGLPPNLVQYEKWKASFQVGKNDFDAAASDPGSTQRIVRRTDRRMQPQPRGEGAATAQGVEINSVRDLLPFLQGAPATYRFEKHNVTLEGFVAAGGYACACAADSDCGYRGKALSAQQFEKHAGVVSKDQHSHIFLRNGTSLYGLFRALRVVPADRFAEAFRMAAGVPMTVPAADGALTEQGQLLEQQPASRELDGLQAVDVTAEQEPVTLDMLSEEERAGLCLLDLRASSSATELDPMHGVEGPAAEEIENVAGDDQAMPDAEEIRNVAGEQPRDSCLSTTTPVKVRVTETEYQPENFLKDVRGLLSTGLLEGFRVTYKKNEVEMTGRINGQGYSCGCSECGYSNIMNECEFEQHSGESSNNQNDHIFLDSGTSLYRVIQALKFTRLYLLGDLIEEQIGLPPNLVQYEKWKASFQVGKNDFDAAASDPCSTQSSQESAAGKTSHIALATTLAYSLKESTSNDSSNLNWSAFKRRSDRLFKRGGTETSTPALSRSPEKGTSGLSTGTSMKSGTEETPSENTAGPLSTDGMKPNLAGPVAVMSTSTELDPINIALSLSCPVTIIQEPPPDHSMDSKSTELCQPKTR